MTPVRSTQKTPVAELGGEHDEGLNPTPYKEQENTMMSHSSTPAEYCRRQRALQELDLPALAHGTVRDLIRASESSGIPLSQLVLMVNEDAR